LKLEGIYTFNAPRDRVWQVLLDPKIIAQCIPGCESMNEVAPDQFEANLKVGVASVKGSYKGKVSIKDKRAPSLFLSGEGSGGPVLCRATWHRSGRKRRKDPAQVQYGRQDRRIDRERRPAHVERRGQDDGRSVFQKDGELRLTGVDRRRREFPISERDSLLGSSKTNMPPTVSDYSYA
jgi:carbon monoxide dehydrogenase subunit G